MKTTKILILLSAVLSLLVACRNEGAQSRETPSIEGVLSPIATALPDAAATVSVPDAPLPVTPLPTATTTPIPLAFPISEDSHLPVTIGTPVPNVVPITAENVTSIQQLARWGKGNITEVAYSPDGRLLAVATSIGVFLYDAFSLAELDYIPSTQWVESIAFSPDSITLAFGLRGGVLQLWRVGEREPFVTVEQQGLLVWDVAFSLDGGILATVSLGDASSGRTFEVEDSIIKLWRLENTMLKEINEIHNSDLELARSISFSPDGTILAASLFLGTDLDYETEGIVRLWRVADGQLLHTLETHASAIRDLTFTPDGTEIAVVADGDVIQFWQAENGTLLTSLEDEGLFNISRVGYTLDGEVLFIVSGYNILLRSATDGENLATLEGHTWWIESISVSPDGTTLASGSIDGTVKLWRISDGALLFTLDGYTRASIRDMALTSDGTLLAVGLQDEILILRMADGSLLSRLEGSGYPIAFAPNSEELATSWSQMDEAGVGLWQVIDGTLKTTLVGHMDGIRSLAFAPNGEFLAVGLNNGTVWVWNLLNETVIAKLNGHTGWVSDVAFAPDNATLASVSPFDTVKLWRVSDGTLLAELTGHTGQPLSVAFAPNGEIVASGSYDSTAQVWRVSDGTLQATLNNGLDSANSVVFSQDSRIIVTGSEGGMIHLWQAIDGLLLVNLEGHTGSINGLSFTSNGATLITSSGDGTVRLWGVPTADSLP